METGNDNAPLGWDLRSVPAPLVERYLDEGWWTDATLGSTAAAGLDMARRRTFAVHSAVNPWRGTIGEIDRAARAFAASLHDRGVGPGDVVLFQLPNWMEAAVTFFGAAYLGASVAPVVHFYGPKEVGYIVDVVQPAVVVTPAGFGAIDYLDSLEPILGASGTDWLVAAAGDASLPLAARPFESALDAAPIADVLPVDPDAPAVIAFTSGTTRDPKGVIHSHRTILCETHQLHDMTPSGGPPSITGAPVGHFIGMAGGLLGPLLGDDPVHLIDQWDPGEVLRLMLEENLGFGGGATYFITSLLDHPDFADEHRALMPYAGLGGSAVPPAVMERLDRLGITSFRAYGSTEHPSITRSGLTDPAEKQHLTDGCPGPGIEIRLDAAGEISSRGPDLCMGYTNPDLTATAFDADGWYRTGDVGVLDADGYLTITDRVSDMIIRGGENISAQEVEDLLMGLDRVAEVAVVAAPDERMGEHATAIFRMLPEAPPPSLAEMREHLRAVGLAKQKWPESVHQVADYPRTPSGKIQKYHLRQQLRDGDLANEL